MLLKPDRPWKMTTVSVAWAGPASWPVNMESQLIATWLVFLRVFLLMTRGPVLKWLGLGSGHGDPKDADLPLLVNLNDNGNSFKKIAAIIRANPEQYFVAHESDNRDSVKA